MKDVIGVRLFCVVFVARFMESLPSLFKPVVLYFIGHFTRRYTLRFIRRFILSGLFIFSLSPLMVLHANVPGASPSGFTVTDGGAASYSLQLAVPPGTAGMHPKISIGYSSQGGNGLLGVGGSISGFSSIHRCVHGTTGTIKHDPTDQFCFDGQKMILVGGVHGAHGAQYRTEMESFSEITAYGYSVNLNGGTAPLYFRVRDKSGGIMWFGSSEMSRIKLPGSQSVNKWMLSKNEDRRGNYYEIGYDMVRPEQCLPTEINYTANDAMGLSFSKKVVIEYEDRPDSSTTWIAGGEFRNDVRIDQIKLYSNIDPNIDPENVIPDRNYKMSYDVSASTLSRLTEVEECAYDDNSVEHCLPPIQFQRPADPTGYSPMATYDLPNNETLQEMYQTGDDSARLNFTRGELVDVNGDGRLDWVKAYRRPGGAPQKETWLNTPTGWVSDPNWVLPDIIYDYYDAVNSHNYRTKGHSSVTHGQLIDINGDGRVDWVQSYNQYLDGNFEQGISTWLNNGNGWTQSHTDYVLPGLLNSADTWWQKYELSEGLLFDINGDGLPDYINSWNGCGPNGKTDYEKVMINDGTGGWINTPNYILPEVIVNWDANTWDSCRKGNDIAANMNGRLIDLNADGLVDYVESYGPYHHGHQHAWLNTGSGWVESLGYKPPEGMQQTDKPKAVFRDLNADGLPDFVLAWRKHSSGEDILRTWLNTGTGWTASPVPEYALPGPIWDYHTDRFGPRMGVFEDLNGDGRVDWYSSVWWKNWGYSRDIWLNTGMGWSHTPHFHKPGNPYYFRYREYYDNPYNNRRNRLWEGYTTGRFVDINGDGATDWLENYHLPDYPNTQIIGNTAYVNDAVNPDLVTTFTNTAGASTTVTYLPMTDSSVYTKLDVADYPHIDMDAPVHENIDVVTTTPLVSSTSMDNGIGGTFDDMYIYAGMRFNTTGEGALGFRWRYSRNLQTNRVQYKKVFQHYPFVGMTEVASSSRYEPTASNSHVNLSVSLSTAAQRQIHHPNGAITQFPYIQSTYSRSNESDGTLVTQSNTSTVVDGALPTQIDMNADVAFGNATSSTQSIDDSINPPYTKSITTKFQNDVTNWLIGLPTEVKTTTEHPTAPSVSHTTHNNYLPWGATGSTVNNVGTPYELTTTNAFDGYGNVIQTQVTGTDITPRTSSTTYDPQGLHAISTTNDLGHSSSTTYNDRCFVPESSTSANGHTSTQAYDAFCRPTVSTDPLGNQTTVSYHNIELPGQFYVETQTTAAPTSREYKDILMRTFHTRGEGFDSQWIGSDVQFDDQGRAYRSSLPYYVSESIPPTINGANGATDWSTSTFDVVGRVIQSTNPDGTISSQSYNGLESSTTNDLGQTRTSYSNARGEVYKIVDNANNAIEYEYNALGNLTKTTDPHGNTIDVTYDILGNKITMDDPDMGLWSYNYNRLGQLISQTDAKGQTITMDYDILGRMITRTTNEGVSTWEYDTAPNALGALAKATGPNYQREHFYDSLSRPLTTTDTVFGHIESFTSEYDTLGRISKQHYPNGFTIRNVYNALGYLEEVRDDSNNQLLWKVDEVDVFGRSTQQTLGNGIVTTFDYDPLKGTLDGISSRIGYSRHSIQELRYTYDSIGNMLSRRDTIHSRRDDFGYDSLNRLTSVDTTNFSGSTTVDVVYDALGNIQSKSDVGAYWYNNNNGAGPNALSSVTSLGFNSAFPQPTINVYDEYHYDANGNLIASGAIQDPQGGFSSWGRQITWTSFNKPSSMQTPTDATTYDYGPEHQRIRKINSSENHETIYYGKTLERHNKDGVISYKYYLGLGSATLELTLDEQSNLWEQSYLLTDHLGSTDVITNSMGFATERLSFDPWGMRRQEDWSHSPTLIESSSTRGFTGHEMDDDIGLINMNARIYDPVLGRFLSPDSVLPDPANLQAFNRYAYVLNSPMGYTDPSGHEPTITGTYVNDNGRIVTQYQGGRESVESNAAFLHRTVGGAYRAQIAQDLGGDVTMGNLREYRNHNLDTARGILGCDESTCSRRDLYHSFATGDRNLADFGLTAAEEYQAMDAIWKSKSAHYMVRKMGKKKRLGTIMSVASLALNFVPGLGAVASAAFSFGTSGGDLSSIAGAIVGAGVGAGVSNAFGAAIKTTGGQFAASVLSGGISSELLGGSFASGAIGGAIGFGLSQLRGAGSQAAEVDTQASEHANVHDGLGGSNASYGGPGDGTLLACLCSQEKPVVINSTENKSTRKQSYDVKGYKASDFKGYMESRGKQVYSKPGSGVYQVNTNRGIYTYAPHRNSVYFRSNTGQTTAYRFTGYSTYKGHPDWGVGSRAGSNRRFYK